MNDQQTTVQVMKQFVQDFVDERDWSQFHDPKNLSMSIAIEAAELMEHFQWVRSDQVDQALNVAATRAEVQEELADIFCYVLAFARTLDIDLCAALGEKMIKNRRKYPVEDYRGRF